MEYLTVTLLSLVTSCTDNCTMGFGSLLPFFIYNKPTCGSMWIMFIRYHSNRKHRNRASLCGLIRKFKYALTEATQRGFFFFSQILCQCCFILCTTSAAELRPMCFKSHGVRAQAKGSVECLTGGSYSPTFNLTTHTHRERNSEHWAGTKRSTEGRDIWLTGSASALSRYTTKMAEEGGSAVLLVTLWFFCMICRR